MSPRGTGVIQQRCHTCKLILHTNSDRKTCLVGIQKPAGDNLDAIVNAAPHAERPDRPIAPRRLPFLVLDQREAYVLEFTMDGTADTPGSPRWLSIRYTNCHGNTCTAPSKDADMPRARRMLPNSRNPCRAFDTAPRLP